MTTKTLNIFRPDQEFINMRNQMTNANDSMYFRLQQKFTDTFGFHSSKNCCPLMRQQNVLVDHTFDHTIECLRDGKRFTVSQPYRDAIDYDLLNFLIQQYGVKITFYDDWNWHHKNTRLIIAEWPEHFPGLMRTMSKVKAAQFKREYGDFVNLNSNN